MNACVCVWGGLKSTGGALHCAPAPSTPQPNARTAPLRLSPAPQDVFKRAEEKGLKLEFTEKFKVRRRAQGGPGGL